MTDDDDSLEDSYIFRGLVMGLVMSTPFYVLLLIFIWYFT